MGRVWRFSTSLIAVVTIVAMNASAQPVAAHAQTAQPPPGESGGEPDAAYGALSGGYRVSDSPFLRLGEDKQTWVPVLPSKPADPPPVENPRDLVLYDVATGETEVIPSEETEGKLNESNLAAPYQGILPPGAAPESVYPPDDRARISPTTSYPWRTLTQLFMTFPDGASGGCSGAIIGCPDGHGYHVLTAGHCVYSHSHGGWATSVEVIPALDDTYMPYNHAWAVNLRSYTGWTVSGMDEHDWALVTLDRNVGDFTGWMGRMTASSSDSVYTGGLNTAGYPCNYYDPVHCPYPKSPAHTMWYDFDFGRTADDYNHWYYMDTQGGQSGSPVWVYYSDTGNRYILTVHAYGNDGSNSNHGTRLNQDKFDRLISWCNADTPPTDYADLIDDGETWSGFSPQTIAPGQDFHVWNDVRNVGTASSGSFSVSYYASTNTIISTNDYLIGTTSVSSLSPFSWTDSDWQLDLPDSIPNGTYWIGWIIDSGNHVSEFDEGNNVAYKSSYQLNVVRSDLIVDSIGVDRPTTPINEPVPMRVYIRNQGAGTAEWLQENPEAHREENGPEEEGERGNSFWTDLYLGTEPSLWEGGFWYQSTESLDPGHVLGFAPSPGFANAGIHYLWAQVDSMGDVSENNEYNNVAGPVPFAVGFSLARSASVDFDGDGRTDIAVWRPSTGLWAIDGGSWKQWGLAHDIPVPGDYDASGTAEVAIYRPSSGLWAIDGGTWKQWGLPGDIPVPGDYDGDNAAEVAIYRPSSGLWAIDGGTWKHWGLPGDIPVPGDYDGDDATEIAVYRPSTGLWAIDGGTWKQWGLPQDVPLTR